MSVITVIDTAGQVGVHPRRVKLVTTDNLATITAPGYLNNPTNLQVAQSQLLLPTDIFDVIYSYNTSTGDGVYSEFLPSFSGATITLNLLTSVGTNPYRGKYSNAGGNATVAITVTGVLSTDIVGAWIESSANAVSIQKVTPTSNTITVLCSGDPGTSVISYVVNRAAPQ